MASLSRATAMASGGHAGQVIDGNNPLDLREQSPDHAEVKQQTLAT
jgi:hypothetical protein